MIHMCILECKRKRCCHFTTHMDMPRGSFVALHDFQVSTKRECTKSIISYAWENTHLWNYSKIFQGCQIHHQRWKFMEFWWVFLKRYGWQRWRSLETLDCPTSFRPSLHPRHPYSGATSASAEISGPWEFEIITTQLGKFHVKSLLTSIILGKVVHPIPSILNPWKLTWNLKTPTWKVGKSSGLKPSFLGFHIKFQGCKKAGQWCFSLCIRLDPSERCDWKIDLLRIFQGGVRCDRTTCATCTHVFLHSQLLKYVFCTLNC